jgi:hypothetical protein
MVWNLKQTLRTTVERGFVAAWQYPSTYWWKPPVKFCADCNLFGPFKGTIRGSWFSSDK